MQHENIMPVYVVIAEQVQSYPAVQSGVRSIVEVIECDLADLNDIWQERVTPYYTQRPGITTTIYAREPANPFRSYNNITVEREGAMVPSAGVQAFAEQLLPETPKPEPSVWDM